MDLIPDLDNIPVISRFRSSLTTKFIVVGLLVLVVLAGVGGYMYFNTKKSIKTDTKENLKQTSRLQSNELSEWQKRVGQQVRGASSANWMTSTIGASKEVAHEALEYRVERKKSIVPNATDSIHVIYRGDDSETVLYSSNKSYRGKALSNEVPYFKRNNLTFTSSRMVTTEPFEHNGTSMIAFAVPIGTRRAAVFMLDLAEVKLSFDESAGNTYVVGENGTVMMSDDDDALLKHVSEVEGIDNKYVKSARTGSEAAKISGGSFVSGYAEANRGWVVVNRKSNQEVFGLLYTFEQTFLAGFGALFLMLGLAGLVVRGIVSDLRSLSEKTRRISEGDYDVDMSSKRSDEIGRIYEAFGEMTDEVRARIDEAREAEEEQRELNRELESNVSQMGEVLSEVADGDLTVRMDEDVSHDQIQSLAVDFNVMLDNVQDAVEQFKMFGRDVATSSEEVTAGVDEVREASDEVTSATQQISDGAVKQDEELDKTIDELNDLTATIDEVAASSDQLSKRSQEAAERREDVQEAAEGASEAFDDIEDNTERAVEAVESLQNGMESISETVESISEVAEQTNMLAINASIEAARAGEAGEGFAVVADEVKELAEEAGKAAEEVEESIETLQERTETTANDISDTMESVERGADTIDEALDELDEITSAVTDVNAGVQQIDEAAEQQAEMSQEVVNHIDDVAEISAETSSQAADVASASEEQTASLTQVSKSVNDLAERAVKLNDKLEEFEVGLDGNVEMDRDDMMIDMDRFEDWDVDGDEEASPIDGEGDDVDADEFEGEGESEGDDVDADEFEGEGESEGDDVDADDMEDYSGGVDFTDELDEALDDLAGVGDSEDSDSVSESDE